MATQVTAVRKTIKAMRAAKTLSDSHAALEGMAIALAGQVDADLGNDALWREYRQALKALFEEGKVAVEDDDSAGFLELVRTPMRAQVGNAKNT